MDISVIIPAYNVERYITEALSSLYADKPESFEVIVLDDGSSDETAAKVEAFAATHSEVRLIRNSNHRQGWERNRGLELSKGKYVYFFDSDDSLKPGALKRLLDLAEAERLDLIMFEGESFYENEALKSKFPRFETVYRRVREYPEVLSGEEMYGKLREQGELIISPCLQFARRKYLLSANVRFPENMSMMEDNLYTVRALLKAKRVRVIKEVLFRRRVRENSTMTNLKRDLRELEAIRVIVSELVRMMREYNKGSIARSWLAHHARAFVRTANVIAPDDELKSLLPELERTVSEIQVSPRSFASYLRGGLKCIRDNGLKYTILNLIDKLKGLAHA